MVVKKVLCGQDSVIFGNLITYVLYMDKDMYDEMDRRAYCALSINDHNPSDMISIAYLYYLYVYSLLSLQVKYHTGKIIYGVNFTSLTISLFF